MNRYHRVRVYSVADTFSGCDTSFVVHGTTTDHRWHGRGKLSVRLFDEADALYETWDGVHKVSSGYLVLNEGCEYEVTVKSDQPVKAHAVFFQPGFVESVAAQATQRAERSLEEPDHEPLQSRTFFERTWRGDRLHARLKHFQSQFATWHKDPLWLSEQFHAVARGLVAQHGETWKEVEAIPASRPATREEIFRRLWKARDWAHAMLHREVTLADMAHIACMSESYFLRTFKQAFDQTPHQFLVDLRLEKARSLLRTTTFSITQISTAVGFQSLGSFSWLFRRRHSLSPDAYRRAMRESHQSGGFL